MLVTVSGLSTPAQAQKYWQGLAAAQDIVKALPEGLSEMETVLSLYRYLTDNVRYDYNDYYQNAGKELTIDGEKYRVITSSEVLVVL